MNTLAFTRFCFFFLLFITLTAEIKRRDNCLFWYPVAQSGIGELRAQSLFKGHGKIKFRLTKQKLKGHIGLQSDVS